MNTSRLLMPQEVEVFYIIPALRRERTLCMKKNGKSQKHIAQLLGVTESAVSQYMSDKRGFDVPLTPKIKDSIKNAAHTIIDSASMMDILQSLVKLARDERVTCEVHERFTNCIEKCDVCFKHDL